jgi:hypothetical protein
MQKKLVRNAGGLSYQRNPLNWLILGGVFLIASIVIGTTFTVISFRQRALNNSERELENTVLLLARHFDRELNNFETVQKEIVRRIQMTGVASPEAFKRQMSGVEVHKALQAEIAVAPDVSGINVFDANGELIKLVAILADSYHQHCGPHIFQGLLGRSMVASSSTCPRPKPLHRRMNHRHCAEGGWAEWSISGNRFERHIASQFRNVLRVPDAGGRGSDFHVAPRRNDAGAPSSY